MNKVKLITNYLDQVSNRATSTMTELKLLQMHIEDIKDTLDGLSEGLRSPAENLPVQPISNPVKH